MQDDGNIRPNTSLNYLIFIYYNRIKEFLNHFLQICPYFLSYFCYHLSGATNFCNFDLLWSN